MNSPAPPSSTNRNPADPAPLRERHAPRLTRGAQVPPCIQGSRGGEESSPRHALNPGVSSWYVDANPPTGDPIAVDRQHVGQCSRLARAAPASHGEPGRRARSAAAARRTCREPTSLGSSWRIDGCHGPLMPDDLRALRGETAAAHWNQKEKSEVHVRSGTLSVITLITIAASPWSRASARSMRSDDRSTVDQTR